MVDGIVGSVTNKTDIHKDTLVDILDTALYGGIQYWAEEINKRGPLDLTIKIENEEYFLTADKMLKGIQLYVDSGRVNLNYILEDSDVEDADVIVQYALFGQVVYG